MSFFGQGSERMANPSISLEQAIVLVDQRRKSLPYNQETIVRAEELDWVLELMRQVRINDEHERFPLRTVDAWGSQDRGDWPNPTFGGAEMGHA